jgi:hypothetical protein
MRSISSLGSRQWVGRKEETSRPAFKGRRKLACTVLDDSNFAMYLWETALVKSMMLMIKAMTFMEFLRTMVHRLYVDVSKR